MLVLTSYLHLEKSKIEFSQDKTQNSDETIVFDRESTSHGPKSLKIVVLLLLFSYVFNIQSSYRSYPYYLYTINTDSSSPIIHPIHTIQLIQYRPYPYQPTQVFQLNRSKVSYLQKKTKRSFLQQSTLASSLDKAMWFQLIRPAELKTELTRGVTQATYY